MKKFEEHWQPKEPDRSISSVKPPSKRQKFEENAGSQDLALKGHELMFETFKKVEYPAREQRINIPARMEICVGTEDNIEIIENGKTHKRIRQPSM